jgi:hypothetical protein
VYDLFFELGYMHYDKTKNYPEAVKAYRNSSTKARTTGEKHAPAYVRHQLAHAIEKMGDIDECVKQWDANLVTAQQLLAGKKEMDTGASGLNTQAAHHNRYITIRRMNERLAAQAERNRNRAEAERLWLANVKLGEEWMKTFPGHTNVKTDIQMAQNNLDRVRSGKLRANKPTELDMTVTVRRTAPRKLEISGSLDVLNLSRVRVQIQDKDYEGKIAQVRDKYGDTAAFNLKMDTCTLEWDNAVVDKGKFKHTINLDRDPAEMEREPAEIYPLKADEYELILTFNPRYQAAFIQDRYGWNGEGITAPKDQLNIDPTRAGVMQGKRYDLRTVVKRVILKREDIVGPGAKVLYVEN